MILKVDNLTKKYPKFTLQSISFSLRQGRVMGLIGKNGAGKSTTLKSMLNMVSPDEGTIKMFNKDFIKNEANCKQKIGVVLGEIDFYQYKKLSDITAVTRRFYKEWDDNAYQAYMNTMLNLLYKEFRLCAHPTLYVFMLMGCLIIIPSYPYGVVFLFSCLAPFITFYNARENHDAFYTALLPVRKSDIVKSKCLLVVIAELGLIIISLPFAYLRTIIMPEGNPVGIEANYAYYGFVSLIFCLQSDFFYGIL